MSDFLTVNEVAGRLKLHPATLTKYIRGKGSPQLSLAEFGGFREAQLTKFIEKRQTEVK